MGLFAALLSAAASGQILHSPQVNLHRGARPEDLSWVWAYATPEPDGNAAGLLADTRFRALLARTLLAPQSFWAGGKPLPEVARDFLTAPPASVHREENRYLEVQGSVAEFPANRGLLWADLRKPTPPLVFAAIDWISDGRVPGEAGSAYTLWLFAQPALDAARLPPALVHSIARWSAKPPAGDTVPEDITRVFLVDPDGTPHSLPPAAAGAHNSLPPETKEQP